MFDLSEHGLDHSGSFPVELLASFRGQFAVHSFTGGCRCRDPTSRRRPIKGCGAPVAGGDQHFWSAADGQVGVGEVAGISDDDKIAIGVRPVNTSREPIPVPASSPLLNVLGATPGSQTVRYSDSSTPDSPAKPFGAPMLQLFVAIENEATTDENEAKFYGVFTKNPVAVGFDEADDGKVATFFARWGGKRNEFGQWSVPVSMTIAA